MLGTKTKYALTGEFNLTLMALTWDDEGTYRCIVGLKEYDMNLTVVGKWLSVLRCNIFLMSLPYVTGLKVVAQTTDSGAINEMCAHLATT